MCKGAILEYAVKLIGDPEITTETLLKSCTEGGDQTDSASKIEKKETEPKKMTRKPSVSKLKNDKAKPQEKAKDDLELLKKGREEVKAELKPILPKKAKDDLDLLSAAKKLQNVNVEELKNDEIYRCAENLKCFLKNARSKLENSDQIAKPLETILELMNVPKDVDLNKTKVPPGVVNKIMDAVKQIQNATKREV